MIDKIAISDFMAVKSQVLDLTPLTIFIGKTDTGKSLVLRALDAVATNRFPADTYARHSKSQYKIQVKLGDTVVSLEKGKGTKYQLAKAGEGIKEFNAVSRDVPEQIVKAVSARTLQLADDKQLEVLYQRQHDKFFLLSEDRSSFSKIISLISSADKLNSLEKMVNSDLLIQKRNKTQTQAILDDYNAQLTLRKEQLKSAESFLSISDSFSVLKQFIEKEQETIGILQEAVSVKENDKVISLESPVFPELTETFNLIPELDSLKKVSGIESVKQLGSLDSEIETASVIETLKEILALSDCDIESLSVPELDSSSVDISELLSFRQELESLDSELGALETEASSIKEELLSFEGQVCPVCGNIIGNLNK